MRLDKFISNQLIISRRDVTKHIKAGKCCVNGCVAKTGDIKINPENDTITFNGEKIYYSEYLYLVMNKPAGVLTATEDKTRKTVLDLVPDIYRRASLCPVGRLDKDTTGLLLLSDNGAWGHKIISPKSNISKTYLVKLDGELKTNMIEAFKNGITLADKTVCKSSDLKILNTNTALLTLYEGKYHEVKRMFGTVDLGVNSLKRIKIGCFNLPQDLKPGECRLLTSEEIALIEHTYTE